MKQLMCSLILGLGLLIAYAPVAEAHGFSIVVHEGKVVRKFRPAGPKWLRPHRDFQRWYVLGGYHQMRHPNWKHLYRLYRQDVRYHRQFRRHLHHRRGHRRGWRHL